MPGAYAGGCQVSRSVDVGGRGPVRIRQLPTPQPRCQAPYAARRVEVRQPFPQPGHPPGGTEPLRLAVAVEVHREVDGGLLPATPDTPGVLGADGNPSFPLMSQRHTFGGPRKVCLWDMSGGWARLAGRPAREAGGECLDQPRQGLGGQEGQVAGQEYDDGMVRRRGGEQVPQSLCHSRDGAAAGRVLPHHGYAGGHALPATDHHDVQPHIQPGVLHRPEYAPDDR